MNIKVLAFEGCPNDQATITLIEEVLQEKDVDASVKRIEVTDETADQLRFLGSPTVQIDGRDIDPEARQSTDFGMSCRTYGENGNVPSKEMIASAIDEALAR